MIYTSYFGKVRAIRKADPSAVFVAICGGLPSYMKDGPDVRWLKPVAPKWSWWNEWRERFKDDYESEESRSFYTEKYKTTVLDNLDPLEIAARIAENMPNGGNAYLLCYETPEKFCHRHLLADWLNRKLGTDIREWKEKNEDEK